MLWDTCTTDSSIREALSRLPKDLDETYVRCLERVHKLGVPYALRVLRYVCEAKSPLHIRALAEALAMDTSTGEVIGDTLPDRFIIDCGANLVVLDPVEQVVLPAHHSVRKFLAASESHILKELELSIWDDAESRLSHVCIMHIHWHLLGRQITLWQHAENGRPVQVSDIQHWVPKPPRLITSFIRKVRKTPKSTSDETLTTSLPRINAHDTWVSSGSLHEYARTSWLS